MKNFKYPQIRKIKPALFSCSAVEPRPFFEVQVGQTYFAKKVTTNKTEEVWETCTEKDLYDPNYKPFLAIPSSHGYAVWDGLTGKPIVCTDREIFKYHAVSPEDAIITNKNVTLNDKGHSGLTTSFFLKHEPIKESGVAQKPKFIETYEEFIKEFGKPE